VAIEFADDHLRRSGMSQISASPLTCVVIPTTLMMSV